MTTEDPKTEIEVPRPGAPEPKPSGRRWTLKKIGGLIAAFAAMGTVLAGLAGYWTTYRTFTKEILTPVKREPIAPSLSVVVLPFSNLTGDAAQDYLGDVITEELTTSFSRIPHSFVIARSTAFTYKGKAVDVRQIGRDLGVRYILEGSQQYWRPGLPRGWLSRSHSRRRPSRHMSARCRRPPEEVLQLVLDAIRQADAKLIEGG
jgi:hypothetical protein